MKKILLIILIPFFCHSQKISVTPFYLLGNERMCLSVTISNDSKNNFYFFQSKYFFHLYQLKGTSKVLFENQYLKNERTNSFHSEIIRNETNKTSEQVSLSKHLVLLKDKYITEIYSNKNCQPSSTNEEGIIKWYNLFQEDILFIPVGGKISFLTTPISLKSYPKGKYYFISDYHTEETEKLYINDFDKCSSKSVMRWFIPETYSGFVRVKKMPIGRFDFKIE